MTYAADRLHEEVAYIAYHFHWSRDDLLDLEHTERADDRPGYRLRRLRR